MQQEQRKSSNQEQFVLVLQGGGALGAYQAGAYEALAENGYAPDWIAGISIGAINAAIIAGNQPEDRVAKLRLFWERVSSGLQGMPVISDGHGRDFFNNTSSVLSLLYGVPGFFGPRIPPPLFQPAAGAGDVGYYTTTPLHATLKELVDFNLLKSGACRLSVGAVNVESGNFAYFDSKDETLKLSPKHIMASGALPPGLPPIEIDGQYYWDGGLVSNTPLQYVLDEPAPAGKLCIFQIDLFSARGTLPETILDAVEREKEIRYSSRTRMNTDMMRMKHDMRCALKRLLGKLPEELRNDADVLRLANQHKEPAVSIVHLIYRARAYETHARDYEFSRVSVEEHWAQGRKDVLDTLHHDAFRKRNQHDEGVRVLDLTRKDRDLRASAQSARKRAAL
jgi:NTE family protein